MSLTKQQVFIIAGIVSLLVIGGLILSLSLKPNTKQSITLTVWGVEDDKSIWENLLKEYTQQTNNKVRYVEKNPKTYERELLDALASGTGPDVFYFKNSWLLKHYKKIAPAPTSLFTARSIEDSYPQVVLRDFVSGNAVYAIPLFIDSLALFYNPSLLDQAAIPFPPKTWEELVLMTPKLTKIDPNGNIQYSAVALGTGKNVQHASDILSLLMIQSGAKMLDEKNLRADFDKQAQTALSFYTQFSKIDSKTYSWNYSMANSLDEFGRGKVAFIFGYARDIPYIRSIAPYLKFKVALMPQPQKASLSKNYADYWGLAVSKQTRYPKEAWQLISSVTDTNQARFYAQRTNLSPAKKVLINQFRNDPIMEIFTKQAFTATSWTQPDPEAVTQIFTETIDNLVSNRITFTGATEYMTNQLNRIFEQLR